MLDAGGKGPRTTSVEARPRHLAGHDSGDGNSGIRSTGEEMEKNPAALDTGGGAACYNRNVSSLDRFQAQHKWEISIIAVKVHNASQAGGIWQPVYLFPTDEEWTAQAISDSL